MAKYIINGGNKLNGHLKLSGNKNATFPCIAAALLTSDTVTLHNIPKIDDVEVLTQILTNLGVDVQRQDHSMTITAKQISTTNLPEQLTSKLRGSLLLAGALLSRQGQVSFSHPGGDIIGKRAIDIHLESFKQLGYTIKSQQLHYQIRRPKVDQNNQTVTIFLRLPTVTGTENLILASVLRPGTTIIRNAAQEPHVVDLSQMLKKMGANILGIGTSTITISGIDKLHGTDYTICPDNIEFGTYAAAAAITGGSITIDGATNLDYLPISWALEKMGVKLQVKDGSIKDDSIIASAGKLVAIPNLITNVWPGFPTDLMSIMIVLATQSRGASLMHDWLYESRMFFVDKLISMGAHITIADPHRVLIYGPSKLEGRNLETPDIRAGIALVLAALVAKGTSVINRAELIERGYENVVGNLTALGADIQRLDDSSN